MGRIDTCYLVPHPPILIKEIGQGEEEKARKTIEAMEEVALDIAEKKPETLIVITPHGPLFKDAMALGVQSEFKGDFGRFGHPGIFLSFPGHSEMAYSIMDKAAREGISVIAVDENIRKRYNVSLELDHGALVPLYFINKRYQDFNLVHITYGLLPPEKLYRFGVCIQKTVEEQENKTSILCSGDLSHRLKKGAPAGYSKRGIEYDRKLVELLGDMDVDKLLNMDPRLIEDAGECAYRSVVTTLGIMDGYRVDSRILSYEGPYGVGYCVAIFTPKGKIYRKEDEGSKAPNVSIEAEENPFVRLARLALESYIMEGKKIEPPEGLPESMLSDKGGTFVSVKIYGQLRGCIGTIAATTKNIAREIINNSISAGTKDPRFSPVTKKELKHLEYSVDVLGQPEDIESIDELDVKKYGVIVRSGVRSGLLLPDIKGVDTVQQQVGIALNKAGIDPGMPYAMQRFKVTRYQ